MRSELVQIIKKMDQNNLETKIALQCAPLLTGIKISNLLIVPDTEVDQVVAMFVGTQISSGTICTTKGKSILLLFRSNEVEAYLNLKEVNKVMNSLGYYSVKIDFVLRRLCLRYAEYVKGTGSFPHELGLFLGYPVEDVVGFIKNQGKNYLFAGYWKVYSNLREAIGVFENYSLAKETVVKMVSLGFDIENIAKMYDSIGK